ncbi:unnamed protein product [Arctogadus glacialis]
MSRDHQQKVWSLAQMQGDRAANRGRELSPWVEEGELGPWVEEGELGPWVEEGELGPWVEEGELGPWVEEGELGPWVEEGELGPWVEEGELGPWVEEGELGPWVEEGELGPWVEEGELGPWVEEGELGPWVEEGELGPWVEEGKVLGWRRESFDPGWRMARVPRRRRESWVPGWRRESFVPGRRTDKDLGWHVAVVKDPFVLYVSPWQVGTARPYDKGRHIKMRPQGSGAFPTEPPPGTSAASVCADQPPSQVSEGPWERDGAHHNTSPGAGQRDWQCPACVPTTEPPPPLGHGGGRNGCTLKAESTSIGEKVHRRTADVSHVT